MKENFLFFLLLFEIIKTTLVDNYNMEIFDEKNYMKGQFAVNSKGDMIIEYSIEGSRLFYGIKKNGKGFFNGEYIKKIELGDNNKVRYESQNIFISLNNNDDNNIEYLLNFGANETFVELINIEGDIDQSENYIIKKTKEVLGNSIFSYVNSLIELNNNNVKEYLLIYIYDQNYFLKKLSFSGFNLDNIEIYDVGTNPSTTDVNGNRMVNGIVFNENYILVLFISGDKYYFNVFEFNLDLIFPILLDTIEQFENDIGLFAKAIYLKENYIAFFYYIKEGKLKFQLRQTNKISEQPLLNFNIDKYSFLSDPRLNEVIKLNSQRCAFFAFREKHNLNNDNNFGEVSDSLTILLFDLYNDYQNLKIREYKIELERYKYHREISATIYNGFICFSSSVYQSLPPNNIISIFMMFGYFNQTNQENNKTINIYEYFSDESNNNNKNIIDDILADIEIRIENNIFGYIFSKDSIRLVFIPSQIEFYNNNGNILNNGDILNKNYILKENSQIDIETGDYYFEYQIIVTEPDYDEFNNKAIKINNYPSSDNGPEQKDFFEPQKFYGKITSINFSLNSYDKLLNNDFNIRTNNDYEIYNILSNNVIQSYPENGESITIETRNRYIYQLTTMDNEISSLDGSISPNNKTKIRFINM